MPNTSINLFAYENHGLEIVDTIVHLPSVRNALFPTIVRRPNTKQPPFQFDVPEEFDTLAIKREYIDAGDPYHSEFLGFVLQNVETDLELDLHVYLGPEDPFPMERLHLLLKDHHTTKGIVTLSQVKQIMTELISTVSIGYAYSEDRTRLGGRPGMRRFETPEGHNCYITIGWMTFFGKDLVNHIGTQRFDRLVTCAEKVEIQDGILVILQKEPFNDLDESHRTREAQAIAELGLEDFLDEKKTK